MIEDRIDGVLVESDEDGFWLVLSGEKAEYRFAVQGIASELLAAVRSEIAPWWAEARSALHDMPEESDEEDAYEVSDPKHPRYHEVMSEIADS